MLKFFNRSLTAKVLTVLGAIVVISFTILCLTILSRQGSLLQEMGGSVNAKLIDTSENAEHEFTALENEVTTSLQTMGEQASASLLGVTERALSEEEKNVSSGMRKLLEANAESVASLIASVGTDSLMAKDYDQLTELSRAGAKTDEILFIFFLGKKEEPLPSYINRVDETIGSYLESFTAQASSDLQEEAQETLVILEKAQADPGVYIHRRPIEYYGLKVGTIAGK